MIATWSYQDREFSQLRSPATDAKDLAKVLADPAIGNFAVTSIINPTYDEMRRRLDEHLSDKRLRSGDLVVIYISGHGLRDSRGELWFAASNTYKSRLRSTGIQSSWIRDCLDECNASQQVLILDCCHSAAYAGTKGGINDATNDLDELFRTRREGCGRIHLYASRAMEYSFEGHAVPGNVIAGSVFTSGLVDALKSAQPDLRSPDRISVNRAFEHASEFVARCGVPQTPQLSSHGVEGSIWLAFAPSARLNRPPALPRSFASAQSGLELRSEERGPSAVSLDSPALQGSGPDDRVPAQSQQTLMGTVIAWGGRASNVSVAFRKRIQYGKYVPPAGLREITAISAGARHSLALSVDGRVTAWGDNDFGQVSVPQGLRRVLAIAAGGSHSLAVCDDGSVVGWGNNNSGQVRPKRLARDARTVAAGNWHSLALLRNGTVVGWGENRCGQARVPRGLRDVKAIAAGAAHSLALQSSGQVTAWGCNEFGQCTVPTEAVDIIAIAAGAAYSMAVRRDWQILMWGQVPEGEIPRNLNGVLDLSAGETHCMVLGSDGVIYAWGDNTFEQCAIPDGVGGTIAISAGEVFSLALVVAKTSPA